MVNWNFRIRIYTDRKSTSCDIVVRLLEGLEVARWARFVEWDPIGSSRRTKYALIENKNLWRTCGIQTRRAATGKSICWIVQTYDVTRDPYHPGTYHGDEGHERNESCCRVARWGVRRWCESLLATARRARQTYPLFRKQCLAVRDSSGG